jgi:hypothetical protein
MNKGGVVFRENGKLKSELDLKSISVILSNIKLC